MKTLRQTPHKSGFSGRPRQWRRTRKFEARERFDEVCGVEAVRYPVPTLKKALPGHAVAYLADLHYDGSEAARRRLAGILTLLRRHPAEVLLLGGDQCGSVAVLPELEPALRLLARTVPAVLATPGNWERGKNWLADAEWAKFYRRNGVIWLSNGGWENEFLRVYGCDDYRNGDPQPPRFPHDQKGHILLIHEPDGALKLERVEGLHNVDLILAGHTHGGQVRVPYCRPFTSRSHGGRDLDAGEFRHRLSDVPLYVTSGAGHLSFPFRFRCPPQVVWIDFVPGKPRSILGRVAAPQP